jgi:hypothetical protein
MPMTGAVNDVIPDLSFTGRRGTLTNSPGFDLAYFTENPPFAKKIWELYTDTGASGGVSLSGALSTGTMISGALTAVVPPVSYSGSLATSTGINATLTNYTYLSASLSSGTSISGTLGAAQPLSAALSLQTVITGFLSGGSIQIVAVPNLIMNLAMKDNPQAGVDKFLTLGSEVGAYVITDINVGLPYRPTDTQVAETNPKYVPPYNFDVLDIDLTVTIQALSKDLLIQQYRDLQGYIERTKAFLAPYRGTIPVTNDGTWFPGKAATITLQLQNSSYQTYWDVLAGYVDPPKDLFNLKGVQNIWTDVKVKFTVRSWGRGSRQRMINACWYGDFAKPFDPQDSLYKGYATVPNNKWTIDTTQYFVGNQCMKWSDTASSTFIFPSTGPKYPTGAKQYYFVPGHTILPSFRVRGNIVSGTLQVKLQKSTDDSTWVDDHVVKSLTNADNTALASGWQKYDGTLVTTGTGGYYYYRLVILAPTSGTLYFDTFALWVNPINGVTPNAFCATGGNNLMPYVNVYGVEGDVDTPCRFIWNQEFAQNADVCQTMIGKRNYLASENVVHPTAFPMYNGILNTYLSAYDGMLWQTPPNAVDLGNPTILGNYGWSVWAAYNTKPWDLIPKTYRALLYYASNSTLTKAVINIGNSGAFKSYQPQGGIPATYTGPTSPPSGYADYRILDLGYLTYPRAGATIANQQGLTRDIGAYLYGPAVTNTICAVAGVILVPADQMYVSKQFTIGFGFIGEINSEGVTPQLLINYDGLVSGRRFDITQNSNIAGGQFTLQPSISGASDVVNNFNFIQFANPGTSGVPTTMAINRYLSFMAGVEYTPRYNWGLKS